MRPCQGTTIIKTSLEALSPEFTTPSSPVSLYDDIATSLVLQPIMSTDEQLTKTLATMEHIEKLMEALNNDLETIKEENCYLKAVVETNNDLSHPDHPLYQPLANNDVPPLRSIFSPPPIHVPSPIKESPPLSEKPEVKYREPKIAVPLPFDGKRENTESFLNSCQLYISARPPELQSEDAKMHWIMSYMQSESARLWRDYIMARVRVSVKQFSNANKLMNEIEAKFGEEDKWTTMSLKIRTMLQGDKHADEHVQEFQRAALEAGYNGYPLVVECKRSLNVGLRRQLQNLRPQPITIRQWYNEAITVDRQWRVAKAEEAFYNRANGSATKKEADKLKETKPNQPCQGNGQYSCAWQPKTFQLSPQGAGNNQGNAAGQKDPNAMDVDRSNWGKRPLVKCYNCQGTGHMARDCRNERKAGQMTYSEMKDYIEQQEALKKDKEESDRKQRQQKRERTEQDCLCPDHWVFSRRFSESTVAKIS